MKQFTFLFIIGLCVANILATCVVQTSLGLLKGDQFKSSSGKDIFAWRGIPYAEPPAGKNRFKNPEPKKPWDHILKADHDRCECPQLKDGVVHGCEDCLHLNVYSPQRNADPLLPVIVYLHSSYYIQNNGSLSFVDPSYLLDYDVVLVVIQYRLSVLGFLSTGDDAASGNYGLKDQALALKWVKENIKNFGGNPEEITLVGEGAGSVSANLHILANNDSSHSVKQCILQSGTALQPRAVAVGPSYHDKGKKVAELLKCPTNDSHKMIECLRNLNFTEIIKVSLRVFDEIDIAAKRTWGPTVEPKVPGAFLTDTPENLIQTKHWGRNPVIAGSVQDEGTSFSESLVKYPKVYDISRNYTVDVIIRFLQYYSPLDGMNVTDIAVKAKNYYIGTKVPESKEVFIEKFTNLVTDLYLFTNLQLYGYLRQRTPNNSFTYIYDYRGDITTTLIFKGKLRETGVGHGSDLFSEFPLSGAYVGPQYSSLKPSRKDYEIIKIFTGLWTSFAKNSVPSSDKLKNSHLWQPQRNSTKHLKIGNGVSTEVTLEEKYSSRVNFWFENVPQYCLE